MTGLPFFEASEVTTTVVPTIEIDAAGGGDSGGFGGMAGAVDSLLGGGGAAALADHLVQMSVLQAMAPMVDELVLTIGQVDGAPEMALGDEVTVRMGAADSLVDLFKGHVFAIEDRSDRNRGYRIGNAGHTLAGLRINQAIAETSVADAAAFIAGEAGVALETELRGNDFSLSQYIADDARSAWQHIATLAELLGASVWVDASDAIHLADALEDGEVVASYSYGSDVLESHLWQRSPHAGAITVFGGARASDGHTLRKQAGPNRSDGGDGAPQRIRRQGVLHAAEDLAARAAAIATRAHRRTTRSELLLPGSTALLPGAVIEVSDLPQGTARLLVLSARHRLDRETGWQTRVEVSEAGDMPGLSGLLGGALGGLP